MQFVRRCYGLRGIYGRFDSKIRFEIELDGRFDLRFDSNAKKTIRRSLFDTVGWMALKKDILSGDILPVKTCATAPDWAKVLRPTRHKIGHFGDVFLSQSVGIVLKKLNLRQQKHIHKL